MFLLGTRHPMVQHMEEHVGMTSLLTFFNKWISCNLHSSGREAQGELTAKQRGVTKFSHKMSLSILLFYMNSIPNEEGCVPTTKGCVHTPKCCVLMEFLPKKRSLILNPNSQGWTHNPNITPGGYPMKFGGFWHGNSYSTHNTANFLIGPFAKSNVN